MKKGLDRTQNDQVNCLPQYKLHLKALNVYIKIKKRSSSDRIRHKCVYIESTLILYQSVPKQNFYFYPTIETE